MTNTATEQMVIDNIPLVHYMVRKHSRYNDNNYDDYVQAGCIGLWLAAQRFDETKGIKFATFAASYIWGYIKDQYSKFECSSLKMPCNVRRGAEKVIMPVCTSL